MNTAPCPSPTSVPSPPGAGPTGVQSSSFPQPSCQAGDAPTPATCASSSATGRQQAPRLGLSPCPPRAMGWHHTGVPSWKDPGRPQVKSCSAHQSPLVFRMPFQFFLQFDDINKDNKSWNTLHLGAFEDHMVTSAAGTSSAVAQVGTPC